jgi:DNA-binding LytR/AlgR family response regulator
VKSGVKRIKLYFDQITHIQGLKDYAIVYTLNDKIVVKGSVKQVHELLPNKDFIRVHKSYLVAKNKINHIERGRIIFGEHQIPIGRNYREAITGK